MTKQNGFFERYDMFFLGLLCLLIITMLVFALQKLGENQRPVTPIGVNDSCTTYYSFKCGYTVRDCTSGMQYDCVGIQHKEEGQ